MQGNGADRDQRPDAGDLRPLPPVPPCGEVGGMAGPGGTTSAALAPPVAETPPAGLSSAEVAERRSRGLANEAGERTSRSVAEILRANILTRFNFILGALLAVILVAGQPQDALFGIVLVTNALIGIGQELRAKLTLDRLAVLSAPRVQVVRDGTPHEIAVAELVAGDLVHLRPGDQLVADGVMRTSASLQADESLLTGESEPVGKRAGDQVLSGSFVVAGSGSYQATEVGAAAYARKLAAEARRFTLVRSELVEGINRILRYVTWAIVPVAALMLISQLHVHDSVRDALTGTVAALVGMVPQGLVLLTSVAFGVAAVTLARRRVLVQQLPAVEGLARVDVVCFDKTGTLTDGTITFDTLDPARRSGPRRGGARRARRRGEPERDTGRHRAGLPAAGRVGAPGRGAVLLGAQVERGQLHRARHLGAGGAGDGAAQRAPGAPGAGHGTRRQRPPGPGAGPGRGVPGRRVAPAGPAARRVHRVRGTAEIRHHRDHRVLRGAGGRA